MSDVVVWLVDNNLGQYRKPFQNNQVTGKKLLTLSEDQLGEIGVKVQQQPYCYFTHFQMQDQDMTTMINAIQRLKNFIADSKKIKNSLQRRTESQEASPLSVIDSSRYDAVQRPSPLSTDSATANRGLATDVEKRSFGPSGDEETSSEATGQDHDHDHDHYHDFNVSVHLRHEETDEQRMMAVYASELAHWFNGAMFKHCHVTDLYTDIIEPQPSLTRENFVDSIRKIVVGIQFLFTFSRQRQAASQSGQENRYVCRCCAQGHNEQLLLPGQCISIYSMGTKPWGQRDSTF